MDVVFDGELATPQVIPNRIHGAGIDHRDLRHRPRLPQKRRSIVKGADCIATPIAGDQMSSSTSPSTQPNKSPCVER